MSSNQFNQSPVIPDATLATHPVTLSQLMSAVLGGVQAGLNYFDVVFRPDGSVRSIHDNVQGKTYVFQYNSVGKLKSIYDGTSKWLVNLNRDKIISVTR